MLLAMVDSLTKALPQSGLGLSSVANTAADAATAIGIAVGGTWAYYKFLKGQTFHPVCELGLVASLVTVSHGCGMRVDVTIKNVGLSPLLLPDKRQLSITAIDPPIWQDARSHDGIVLWSAGLKHTQDMLEGESWKLQPKEGLYWSGVIPLPEGQCCYLVNLKVEGASKRLLAGDRRTVWETRQVVVPEEG
jgi:hypothetical protein